MHYSTFISLSLSLSLSLYVGKVMALGLGKLIASRCWVVMDWVAMKWVPNKKKKNLFCKTWPPIKPFSIAYFSIPNQMKP